MKTKKKSPKNRKSAKKQLIQKAGIAMKNQFFLEASWLISEILEKRLKSLLEIAENQKPGAGYSLEQCIKRLKHIHMSGKSPMVRDHIDMKLIEKARSWKNQRNTMVKDMLFVHVSKVRKEKLAMDGIRLLKEWNKEIKAFKAGQLLTVTKTTEEIPPQ
ncbi:MAG: hypothetical protein WCO93_01370 [bacterium]